MNYSLIFPQKVVFGNGSLTQLPELLPQNARILLVTGKHAEKSGLLGSLQLLLDGFEVVTACGITAEPPLEEVDKLIKAGRFNSVNAVVAIGGGSVIDAAKAAAAIIPLPGTIQEYFYNKRQIPGKGLFFAALPTTAGTGAEITPNSVLIDLETDIKKSIKHETMVPDVAIVDPELTYSCPMGLTVASGLDALTQAIESYISLGATSISKALAAKSAELLFAALPKIRANLNDKQARSDMAEGCMIGAIAFTQSSLGAVHGIAHPIGSKLHVPHGISCAVLLPVIMRANLPSCPKEMEELGRACGCNNAEQFIEEIEKLCQQCGIPDNFREYGFDRSHFPFVVAHCRSGSMLKNPRQFSDEEVIEILETLI